MLHPMHIFLVLVTGVAAAPLNDPQENYLPPESNYLPPESSYLPATSADFIAETTVLPEVITTEGQPLLVQKNSEALTQAKEIESETKAPAELTQESAALNDDGYAYRTVRQRRLRYRTQRDVAHLNLAYLPPPSQEYLPPVEEYLPPSEEYMPPSRDYLPPARDYLPPSNDYLPPSHDYLPPHEDDSAVVTEQPVDEIAPIIDLDYLPPVVEQLSLNLPIESEEQAEPVEESEQNSLNLSEENTGDETLNLNIEEDDQEAPTLSTEAAPVAKESPEPETQNYVVTSSTTEPPQDTAVLEADGYHYKQPAVAADLSGVIAVTPVSNEYLPPAEETVATETVSELTTKATDSSDAGYHYKSFKRFRY